MGVNVLHIVITDGGTVFDSLVRPDIFSEFGDVTLHHLLPYEQLAEAVRDADIVLCNKSLMNAETLRFASHLQFIGVFATGYNNIDLPYCREHGITVCNAGSYSTEAVAQHTFAMMLEWYSSLGTYRSFVDAGGWKASDTFSPFVCNHHEICGKTLGIVGFGHIGEAVARIALAFGMTVLAYNRSEKSCPGVRFVSFEQLLAESDVVTVHCPLNADSARMFGAAQFSAMKPDALFINTARGGVMDENALRHALENGEIGGAAVDVLTEEPMQDSCPLFGAPNCILTPHVAWAPVETRMRLIGIVSDNIRCWMSGKPVRVVS